MKKKVIKLNENDIENLVEKILKEESGTNRYDLSSKDNVDEMMRDITGIINKYVGVHSTNNAAIGNDNRVILYNMINSGKFQNFIQMMLPPSTMHQGYDHEDRESYIWTNNPEAMSKFLKSLGINDSNFRSRN